MLRCWSRGSTSSSAWYWIVETQTPKRQRLLRRMETHSTSTNNKDYVHYNHSGPKRFSRWTARESYQFMYGRPGKQVIDFYSNLVNGTTSFSALFRLQESRKEWELGRVTFKVVLGYQGSSFDGWQKQPGLNTVQGLVKRSLGRFVDEKKARLLKHKCLHVEACAVVAGRTDKGVTAFQEMLGERILHVKILKMQSTMQHQENSKSNLFLRCHTSSSKFLSQTEVVSLTFTATRGKLLSYKMFARDTKASRNEGPPTECFIHHAGAAEARLPTSDSTEGRRIMCLELVANCFLRKMVRVLVATSIREAAAGAEEDVLLKLMDATCRRATAPPAPPDGLSC